MVMGRAFQVALLAAGGLYAASLAAPARAADSVCPAVWPPRASASSSAPLDAGRLLMLRDIGHPEPDIGGASPLAVSPGGSKIAFFIAQASLEANDACETLVVLDLAAPNGLRVVDSGGTRIRIEEVLRGVRRESGVPDVNRPEWSPDGRTLLYRKRVGGRTQAWQADLTGGGARQRSNAEQDVEALHWSADGAHVLYAIRPGREAEDAARRAEARTGFLYDSRVLPHLGTGPQLPAKLPEAIMVLPTAGGLARPATPDETRDFVHPAPIGAFDLGPHTGRDGRKAGAEPIDQTYFAPSRIWAQLGDGSRIDCTQPGCTGWLRQVWWQGEEVVFLRREGWAKETSALAAWSPRTRVLRTIVRTGALLTGCTAAARDVICLSEASRQPRRILAIDLRNGRQRVVFDPNPEIAASQLPRVQRLRWKNALGLEAWGDLVVPDGTAPPTGWPLVVVQYSSEGFLRGGTGDEYPIFALAARSIAVLSYERPQLVASLHKDVKDEAAFVAANYHDWADRRSVHDSLMKGLDLVLGRGDIDPKRIGISGLSDGSTTARYALIHSPRFAAAAISTCCLEQGSTMAYGGTAQADWFRSMGYPDASRDGRAFWLPISMALNAGRMDTPLLMQLADDEYLQSLETFTALREHGRPVEVFVFPGEHHNKWQPQHRAAVYARNLDWFSFWLQGLTDPDPAKAAQYRRWEAMRPAAATRASAASAP